jgi:hypothetical protein
MDLPDGTVLSIVPLNAADDLDDEERAELHREIAAPGGMGPPEYTSRTRDRQREILVWHCGGFVLV